MSREQIRKFRYTCDGMKPVTHTKDGRQYTSPMEELCDTAADFEAHDQWDADNVATNAGWVIEIGSHYCQSSHTPWHQCNETRAAAREGKGETL